MWTMKYTECNLYKDFLQLTLATYGLTILQLPLLHLWVLRLITTTSSLPQWQCALFEWSLRFICTQPYLCKYKKIISEWPFIATISLYSIIFSYQRISNIGFYFPSSMVPSYFISSAHHPNSHIWSWLIDLPSYFHLSYRTS